VPNPENFNLFARIIDFIHDSIVADPYSPVVLGSGKFMTSSWPWIIGKRLNARQDTIKESGG
jgi:hypothetical protein